MSQRYMDVLRELRHAVRNVARTPAYALTCIAILALGIGVNTAIFSVVYSVILTPLPYPDASRLVFVWEHFPNMPDPPGGRIQVTRKNYLEWKRQNTVFADMAAFTDAEVNETGLDHPRHVSAGFASANLFSMLGAQARIGRLFAPEEERKDADRVVVLTDKYFESRFHRDRGALGRTLTLGGANYTVIGVLPPKFHLPAMWEGMDQKKPEVWVPLSRRWNTAADETSHQLYVTAKLKPGVPLAQARTEMSGISRRLAEASPDQNPGWKVNVFPFAVEDTAPTLHRALYVLLGAVAFLLLIACANLANLTLARASARTREVGVRLALGATRGRIIRQLLTESFVVSIAGAAAGLLLAHWAVRGMIALQPPELQRPELIEINLPVFAFAAFVSAVTALLFGLAPALTSSRLDLSSAMKVGGASGGSVARARSRKFLIAIEVALALVLVTGAGLMIRSFRELLVAGIGFKTERLTTIDIDLPETRYPNPESQSRFFRDLMNRTRAVPGVAAASVVDNLPLHRISVSNFYVVGRPDPPKDALPMADLASGSPQYLSMIGMRLLAGRFFTDSDLALNEKEKDGVVIVNQALATKFFPGENALGKRILNYGRKQAFEIVGIVSDYRPMGTENGTRPQIFSPCLKLTSATLIVRTHAASETMIKPIQNAIWSIDKDLPASKVETMEKHLDYWLSQRRFNTLLLSIFAGLALVLAMIGVYGVLANMVASRTREIGIRMAIGATPADVGKLVLAQSMLPVAIGLAVGLAGSLALSRFLETLLYQVHATDPATLSLAVFAILLISPAAIYFPLRRAVRVDCTVALRQE